jgi:hypothetical protein
VSEAPLTSSNAETTSGLHSAIAISSGEGPRPHVQHQRSVRVTFLTQERSREVAPHICLKGDSATADSAAKQSDAMTVVRWIIAV